MLYLFLFAFICTFIFASQRKKYIVELKYVHYLFFLSIISLLVLSIKSTIDMTGYEEMYSVVKTLTNYNSDIGFNFLILIHRNLFNDFESFYFLIGIFNICLIFYISTAFKNIQDKIVFLLCYSSFFLILKDMIQIRNALALNIFVIAIFKYFDRKRISFILLFLLSIAMHNSILIFIIPLIFRNTKITWKKILCLEFCFLFSYLICKGLLGEKILPLVINPTSRFFKYLVYGTDKLSVFHFFKLCLYLVFIKILSKNRTSQENFWFVCICFAYILRIVFNDFSFLTSRLAENCFIGECFIFVNIFKNKTCKAIYKISFLGIYLLLNLNMILKNLDYFNVYQSKIGF